MDPKRRYFLHEVFRIPSQILIGNWEEYQKESESKQGIRLRKSENVSSIRSNFVQGTNKNEFN